ncbi:MAG: DUF1919 domain-containing protein, partial [Flavobacterium sp.]
MRSDRQRLRRESFTIICNNCIGGVIYSDFQKQFQSPTINLFFYAPDYIKFLENLNYYLGQKLCFVSESKYTTERLGYPIGKLDDIEIHFQHYASEEDAYDCWCRRITRIDFDNLYIIGSDRDYSTEEIRHRFSKLPYQNKLYFVSRPAKYKHEIYFDLYKGQQFIGELISDKKAWYYYFDFSEWINNGVIKQYYFRKKL